MSDSEQLRELVNIFSARVQEAEDLFWDLIVKRYVSTSEGVQLNQWGVVLGLARNGLSDTDYQRALSVWQRALRSEGIRDEIISAINVLMEPDAARYYNTPPAAYTVEIETDPFPFSATLLEVLLQIMEAASPSGVAYQAIQGETDKMFLHDSDTRGHDLGLMGGTV